MHGAAGCDLIALECIEHRDMVAEAGQGFQQSIELPAFLKLIKSSERGDDTSPHASLDPLVMHDLDVLIRARLLDPCEHRGFRFQDQV